MAGRRPTEAMQVLAGLERIEYVFVYPGSGDLVLAGPAGDKVVPYTTEMGIALLWIAALITMSPWGLKFSRT